MKTQRKWYLLWVSGERFPEMLHLLLPLFTISMTALRNKRLSNISHSCALNPSLWIFPTHYLPICLLVPGKCQLNPTLFRKLFSGGGKLAKKTWVPVTTLPIAVWPETNYSPSLGLGFFVSQRVGWTGSLSAVTHYGWFTEWNRIEFLLLPTSSHPLFANKFQGLGSSHFLGLSSILIPGKVRAAYEDKVDMKISGCSLELFQMFSVYISLNSQEI